MVFLKSSRNRLFWWVFYLITAIMLSLILLYNYVVSHFEGEESSCIAELIVTPGESLLSFVDADITVQGVDKDGTTFFFVPSFLQIINISQDRSEYKLCSEDGNELNNFRINKIEEVYVSDPEGDLTKWKVGIFNSKNINTVYIELKEDELDSITREEYFSAALKIYSADGKITYQDDQVEIKGRGNGTWGFEKKPYEVRISRKYPLCGMRPSKKWALLANHGDPTKILNKMAFDTAKEIDMANTIDSDWADLYINGQYQGNYLLCHEPNIDYIDFDSNRGYLFEYLPYSQFCERRKDGIKFWNAAFAIKEPDIVVPAQEDYLMDYLNKVDRQLHLRGIQQLKCIDIDSFTRRFLIEEVLFNFDATIASYYYYLDPNSDKIYAGPCWDYDGACGGVGGLYKDVTKSVLYNQKYRRDDTEPLDWDRQLMSNEKYYDQYVREFFRYRAVFRKLTEEAIDAYYDRIKYSVAMDQARWSASDSTEESEIRINEIKLFLKKRLDYLSSDYSSKGGLE